MSRGAPAALLLPLLLSSCGSREAPPAAPPADAGAFNVLAELAGDPLGPEEPGRSRVLHENADHTVILMQVNGVAQRHYHIEHDEVIHVLAGSGVFTLGDREYDAKPGDVFVVPRGTVHGFRKTGEGPAAMLSIYTPRLSRPDSYRPPGGAPPAPPSE